jgi:hypothetical protein
MSGEFSIEIDAPRNLLRVRMSGFYSLEDVERYHAAVDAATLALGGAPSRQLMLNDISGMQIQAQEIIAAFKQVVSDPRYRERRVGFVVASSLARLQLVRVIGGRNAQLFESEAEALAWLLSPRAASAA